MGHAAPPWDLGAPPKGQFDEPLRCEGLWPDATLRRWAAFLAPERWLLLAAFLAPEPEPPPKPKRVPGERGRQWAAMLEEGVYPSRAALARAEGVSRVAVTQAPGRLSSLESPSHCVAVEAAPGQAVLSAQRRLSRNVTDAESGCPAPIVRRRRRLSKGRRSSDSAVDPGAVEQPLTQPVSSSSTVSSSSPAQSGSAAFGSSSAPVAPESGSVDRLPQAGAPIDVGAWGDTPPATAEAAASHVTASSG